MLPEPECKQLELLLSSTAKGNNILKEYNTKGTLSVLQRKHLIECIVETYTSAGVRIPIKVIQFYSDVIKRLFSTEVKVFLKLQYFIIYSHIKSNFILLGILLYE